MLASAYPRLRLVVEDLPEPIESAASRLSGLPDDIKGRIEVIKHDFFNPQPKISADVYLLRTIIHDWADADAVKILQSIAKAMTTSSILLIMDMVLPEPGSEPSTFEATLRQKDLTMIQAFNAKERESEEWRALLARVVPKLTIRAIRRPSGSELSVIEAVLDRQDEIALVNNKSHEGAVGS
jgi:6-hydroxytryprostatin B O-methyltransferase